MKGLLWKDMRALKSTFTILAGFMLVYAAIGVVSGKSSMLTAVLAIVIMMLPANSISYDEFYHWDKYVLTMPISRKMVVQSKFVLCFLLVGFMLVVGTVFAVMLDTNVVEALFSTMLVAAMSLLISVLSLPCMLKWGAQRGRMVMVMLCAAAGSAWGLLVFALGTDVFSEFTLRAGAMHESMVVFGVAVLTAIVTMISYRVSLRLYERKEF